MTFPAFRPTQYGGIQHGTFPAANLQAMSGKNSTTRYSSLESGITTTLTFHLTQTQWRDLITHSESVGTVYSFLFTTETLPASDTPSGYRWRYTAPPEVSDDFTNFFTVSCSFRADFYPNFRLQSETAVIRIVPVETTPTFTPSAPAAPSLAFSGVVAANTSNPRATVGGLALGATWEFSTDGGSTWQAGRGDGFAVPEGAYGAGAIRVRQSNAAGASAATLAGALQVNPLNSVTISFSCAAGATATGTVVLPGLTELIQLQTSRAGWLRLYSSAAISSSDAARPRTTGRTAAGGILLDPIFTDAQVMNLLPFEDVRNLESPRTNVYPWRFTNDGATGDVVITLTWHPQGS